MRALLHVMDIRLSNSFLRDNVLSVQDEEDGESDNKPQWKKARGFVAAFGTGFRIPVWEC